MSFERKKLSDILLHTERDQLQRAWSETAAADDLKPIPAGDYRCRIMNGHLFKAKTGTPGYKLTLEVIEGACSGRRVWHDIWLSSQALGMAKRDLAKLGIKEMMHLENPFPEGFIVSAKVVIRRGDDGSESNRLARFDVVSFEPPTPEPFPPDDYAADDYSTTDADGFDWRKGRPTP